MSSQLVGSTTMKNNANVMVGKSMGGAYSPIRRLGQRWSVAPSATGARVRVSVGAGL